ncbi:MAG: tetratricopeptide repeat protein [Bacteroidota bacterium]
MKKLKHILFLFTFAFLHLNTSAQTNTDLQLAQQFYDNKEFDKALDYYEKLYNKVSSEEFYTPYLNCLLELKEFKKAEKVVKKQIKQKPESPDLFVDLGTVYERAEDSGKAKNSWELAIKSIKHDDQVFIVAKAFIAIKQYDYAIATYLRGRKMSENDYPFSFELADVYAIKGDKMAMINEYLDVLESQDSYIQSVQNALQTSFGNEADVKQNELLKAELLKRIAKNPDKTILSELLIWMQIQQKDFEGAFIQAKALDKRKKEEGNRIMNLAKLCTQNESYDVAVKAYQYVISKGPDNFFYASARMELLDVSYQKIVLKGNYNLVDLTELEKNYQITITELGKSASTVPLLKNLAHLQAFYLNKPDDAIALLGEAIALPQLTLPIQAECKLELADILLMTGDIWEASLRYSQVEKSFKYDAIGQEAKFRNAKISYYTGDFMWAQAQLDVLKGATAKLIANDAMDLSLLISDALAIDTNVAPLMIFSRADLLAFQNKDEQAKITLDSINTLFPNHALADDILYKKAKIVLKHGNYSEAAALYDTIIKNYGDDILGDDALFKLAELNENQFKNLDKAKELYQQLLIKYPGSLYVVEARKRFRKLRGDSFN